MRLQNGNTLSNNSYISRLYNSISIKNVSILYLIVITAFYPLFAYSANANSWTLNTPTRSGASSLYTATKQTLGGLATSSATLIPTARAVGGMALRGALGIGVGLAVSLAIEALLPDNPTGSWTNQGYVYTPQGDPKKTSQTAYGHPEFADCYNKSSCEVSVNAKYSNADCNLVSTAQGQAMQCYLTLPNGNRTYANMYPFTNTYYDPNYTVPPQQTLSYDNIGQKVIDMANAGNPTATAYVGTVADTALDANPANQLVSFGSLVNQLEANAVYPSNTQAQATTNTQASTVQTNASQTETTSQSQTQMELPAFCSYATALCDWIGWTKEIPEPETDTLPPAKVLNVPLPDQNLIVFNKSCPAPVDIPINLFGNTNHLNISYTPLCDFLSMLRPFLIACAYISAGYIILGISRGK